MIFCYKNKYINKFHTFAIEIDIRNTCQKVGSLDGKMTQSWLKMRTFSFFSRKTAIFKETFFCYYKNRNTCQFYAFTIQIDFGNMSERGEFRFKNNMKNSFYTLFSVKKRYIVLTKYYCAQYSRTRKEINIYIILHQ